MRNNLNRTFVCLLEKSTGHLKKEKEKKGLYCIVVLYIDISCKQIGTRAKQHMQHYTKQICTACLNNYHVVCESIKGWIEIHVSLACCQNEQKVRGDERAKEYGSHLWQWMPHIWSKLSFSYYTSICTLTHAYTHTRHLTAKKWHVNCSCWLKGLTAIQSKRENSTMDDRNLSYCQSCRARQGGSADAWCFNIYSI